MRNLLLIVAVTAIMTGQTYTLYNGRNYQWMPGNGRSYQTCLAFYAVDALLSFNGVGPGTAATLANLDAQMETFSQGRWAEPQHLSFGASIIPLPGSISINNGPSHGCGYTGQTIVADDSYNLYYYSYIPQVSLTQRIVVVSGYFNSGPTTGGYDSMVVAAAGGGQALQLGLLTNDCAPAYNLHPHGAPSSGCLAISANTTYYFSWLIDGTDNSATSKFALYSYPDAAHLLGQVDYVLGTNGVFNGIGFGNNESSSQSGKTTTFQWIMVDYSNHVFPNVLH